MCSIYYTTLYGLWVERLLALFEETAAQAAPFVIVAALTIEFIQISTHLVKQLQHFFTHLFGIIEPKGLLGVTQ